MIDINYKLKTSIKKANNRIINFFINSVENKILIKFFFLEIVIRD